MENTPRGDTKRQRKALQNHNVHPLQLRDLAQHEDMMLVLNNGVYEDIDE